MLFCPLQVLYTQELKRLMIQHEILSLSSKHRRKKIASEERIQWKSNIGSSKLPPISIQGSIHPLCVLRLQSDEHCASSICIDNISHCTLAKKTKTLWNVVSYFLQAYNLSPYLSVKHPLSTSTMYRHIWCSEPRYCRCFDRTRTQTQRSTLSLISRTLCVTIGEWSVKYCPICSL